MITSAIDRKVYTLLKLLSRRLFKPDFLGKHCEYSMYLVNAKFKFKHL